MVGWSLGRAAGERAAAGVKGNDAADSPTRRPFRSTSAANRARPSSMISLDFPSSDVVAEAKGSEDEPAATALQHDRLPAPASAALHMLAAAQQRDKAHRQRTTSIGSSHSGTSDHRRARKSSAAPTTNSPMPSLIKTYARSPVAAISTTSTLASPSLDRNGEKDQRISPIPMDRSRSQDETLDLRAGSMSNAKALSNITNTAAVGEEATDDVASVMASQRQRKSKKSRDSTNATAVDSAVDSLLRLQSKENIPTSPNPPQTADDTSHEPHATTDATPAEPEQSTHDADFPYEIRRASKRRAAYSRTEAAQPQSPPPTNPLVRYEVTLDVNRSLALLSFSAPQTSQHRQLDLIAVPAPRRVACDRVAHWTVERGSRIAACMVNLLGS